jgi:copper transport protein
MRRWLQALLALAAAAVLSVLLAPTAGAHTVMVGSDPADGSRLAKSPAAVTIRFDEQVGLQLGYLRVVESSGRRVDNGPVTHPGGAGTSISVPLKPGLPDGNYLASFRVISADGHPVGGSIRYVVGKGALDTGASGSGSAPVAKVVSTSLAVSHWLSLAGVGLAGGSWLVFSLWPDGRRRRSIRRLIWFGWSLAALGALTECLIEGPYAAGTSLATVWHTDLLNATLHGNAGHLLSLRLVLLGVLGMVLTALFSADKRGAAESGAAERSADLRAGAEQRAGEDRREPSWGPEAAGILGLGIVITFAAAGHSQSLDPRWLSVLIDAVHLSAMIIWLGGLAVLVVAAFDRAAVPALARDDAVLVSAGGREPLAAGGDGLLGHAGGGADPAATGGETQRGQQADLARLAAGLPVFSRIALACVATLAVTGTIQAWRETGTLDALATTRYGQLVLFKVLLFGCLVGLGYFARRAVQGRSSGVAVLRRLRRTLLAEVLIGALVLAATGVLVSQPPGKVALAAERIKPRHASVTVTARSQARVEIDPGVHGNVRIAVQFTGDLRPTAVTATASLPAQKLGPIPVALQAVGPQSYTATGVLLPAAGTWEITLSVKTSEFDSTVAVAKVKVS